MEIAVVILNWNGKHLLKQFLPSIVKHSSSLASIYVIDNASKDDSVRFVGDHFPSVKIIQNKDNGGYAKGYNDGLKQINADIYALINSDIEVTKNWLEPMQKVFENQKTVAAIQPKILSYHNKSLFEYAGAAGGFMDALAYPYCRGRIFNHIEEDHKQYDDDCDIFWASGACFLVRSKVFHETGGFDEDFFAHQEEIDLCWRIKNLGYSIKYIGSSKVYHVGGATLGSQDPKKTYLNFRNSLFNLIKNLPKQVLIPSIFFRMVLDGLAGVKYLIELKPQHTLAILKAHGSFYRNLGKFLKKRQKQKRLQKFYLHKSIIWQHYVLRRKKFSSLKNH